MIILARPFIRRAVEVDLTKQHVSRIRSLAWVSSQHLECGVDETKEEVREALDLVITGEIVFF